MKALPHVDEKLTRRIVAAAVVSLVAWVALESLSPRPTVTWSDEMYDAAGRVWEAMAVVTGYHGSAGIEIDEAIDPNRTGLVGPEYTELFTTLGQLEAKRTTTNPDMAALMVHLLAEAGVSAGDTIAVGASGSFPALMIATLAASEAMGAHAVVIISLGASSYGATRPDLDLLRIYQLLLTSGVISTPPSGISRGGEDDVGGDFDLAFREQLLQRIRGGGIPLLYEPQLRANVMRRMEIYLGAREVDSAGDPPVERDRAGELSDGSGRVSAFVNIGGNAANLGTSPMVLGVAPGLNESLPLPPLEERGILYEMSARGIPVVHLLHVRGLALSHGLPWDPVPLPESGATRLTSDQEIRGWPFWLITGGYLATLFVIAVTARLRRVRQPG